MRYRSDGQIEASRFVRVGRKIYEYDTVHQAISGDIIMGVSTDSSQDGFVSYAAKDREFLWIYEDGEHLLELGGPVTGGDFITTDNYGRGIRAITGQWIGGVAVEDGVLGDKIRFFIKPTQCKGAGAFSNGFSNAFS